MKSKIFCTCCRKEIPNGEIPIKYEKRLFDGANCLNVVKKLKVVYEVGFQTCN